ncbi:hypothetical protein G7Y89_g9225 [Cudoniella acicularis]|uniref:Gfd2/YDR514C-like C-terminal domain-containing protein n=1 Tax=Cudoniella acicularis TaxID=354080 RepID=A0A8H4RF25_9HELO|nr:hypothetical protein G7Y89_g9225 [Cudoniella acicularis]
MGSESSSPDSPPGDGSLFTMAYRKSTDDPDLEANQEIKPEPPTLSSPMNAASRVQASQSKLAQRTAIENKNCGRGCLECIQDTRKRYWHAGLELLEKLFLHKTTDVTTIAMDFEYLSHQKNSITEIGISTLSTDESPTGAPHKVVLVRHQISAELDIMENLGINLRDQKLFAIEGILDICTITRGLNLPLPHRPSLKIVLEFLRIPFQKCFLHNAENDAHFALRALLMLAAVAFERSEEQDDFVREGIESLKAIAMEKIDFNSRTPDAKRFRLREEIPWVKLKRKPVIEVVED